MYGSGMMITLRANNMRSSPITIAQVMTSHVVKWYAMWRQLDHSPPEKDRMVKLRGGRARAPELCLGAGISNIVLCWSIPAKLVTLKQTFWQKGFGGLRGHY